MQRIHHNNGTTGEQELTLNEIAHWGVTRILQALKSEATSKRPTASTGGVDRLQRLCQQLPRSGRLSRGQVPRVNGKEVDEQTGERKRFKSVILPPYMRRGQLLIRIQ